MAPVRRFTLRSQPSPGETHPRAVVSIFLVEDNPADAGLVRKAVEHHGIEGELILATDGEIAIAFIDDLDAGRVPCPHLAIIDLNLPRKPGKHVLERMRQSPHCGSIAVAILSSSDAEEDRAAASRLGASRYLRKPSRLEEFLNLGRIFKEMLGQTTQ